MSETIEQPNGVLKLYYALNRKASEMADILDAKNLKSVSLDDPKDKTFDRLRAVWNDSSDLSEAIDRLGKSSGIIVANKEEDVNKVPFVNQIAENRR